MDMVYYIIFLIGCFAIGWFTGEMILAITKPWRLK
jgi:hypothetical protein